MIRTQFSALIFLVCLVCLVGCGRSVEPVASTSGAPTPALSQTSVQGSNTMSLGGIWSLAIDPASLQGRLAAKSLRSGTQTDDTYALNIDRFFRPSQLQLASVRKSGADLVVTFAVQHPFPAPMDPAAPPNAFSNRADLAFSGVLAMLGEVASPTGNTFFGDRVVNTSLVTNPHGYFSPEGLLPQSLTANTFPYRLLVHDADGGNRIGIDNGGNSRGNFGADGWTRAELGSDGTGWVGYNVLHQGQSSLVEFTLDGAYVSANDPLEIDLAIFVKYNDPRGGTTPDVKIGNRLPPATPDVAAFSYRMPHGTWDVPVVIARSEGGGFAANSDSSSLLRVSVEDWDVTSPETTESDLSLEANPRAVNVGASGLPGIDVCIPGVLGDVNDFASFTPAADRLDDDSAYGDGDVGADTGLPADSIFFEHLVTKPVGAGQASGTFTGLVRVTDPEDALPTGYIPLDTLLQPLSTNLPHPVTYQTIEVSMTGSSTELGWAKLTALTGNAGPRDVILDDENNIYLGGGFTEDVNFGGGLRTWIADADSFIASYDQYGNYRWDRTWGNGQRDFVYGLALTGPSQSTLRVLGSYRGTVDPGLGPLPDNTDHQLLVASFSATNGQIIEATAQGGPNNDFPLFLKVDAADRIIISGESSGDTTIFGEAISNSLYDPWIARAPATMDSLDWAQSIAGDDFSYVRSIAIGDDNAVIATGAYTNELIIDGVNYDGFGFRDMWVGKFGETGAAEWVNVYGDLSGPDGTVDVHSVAVAASPADTIYLAAYRASAEVDFGGGVHPIGDDPAAACLVRLDPDGNWISEQWYGADADFNYFRSVQVMSNGDVVACGIFETNIDLGGGSRSSQNPNGPTMFLFRTTASGDYVWDALWAGGGTSPGFGELATGSDGTIVLTGFFDAFLDGNPGSNSAPLLPNGESNSFVIQLPGTPGW